MSKIAIKSANELETSAKTRRAAKLPSTLLPHLNSDLVTQIQVTILDNLSATHEIDDHYDQAIEVDFFRKSGDVAVRVPNILLEGVDASFWTISFNHVTLNHLVELTFIEKELVEKGDRTEAKTYLGGNANFTAKDLAVTDIYAEVTAAFDSIGLRITKINLGKRPTSLYIEYVLTPEAMVAPLPPRYQKIKNIQLSDGGKVYFSFFPAWHDNVAACRLCYTPLNRWDRKDCHCIEPSASGSSSGSSSGARPLGNVAKMRKKMRK